MVQRTLCEDQMPHGPVAIEDVIKYKSTGKILASLFAAGREHLHPVGTWRTGIAQCKTTHFGSRHAVSCVAPLAVFFFATSFPAGCCSVDVALPQRTT
jgi:hypothetical protein